jgi:hypothetical protein
MRKQKWVNTNINSIAIGRVKFTCVVSTIAHVLGNNTENEYLIELIRCGNIKER